MRVLSSPPPSSTPPPLPFLCRRPEVNNEAAGQPGQGRAGGQREEDPPVCGPPEWRVRTVPLLAAWGEGERMWLMVCLLSFAPQPLKLQFIHWSFLPFWDGASMTEAVYPPQTLIWNTRLGPSRGVGGTRGAGLNRTRLRKRPPPTAGPRELNGASLFGSSLPL